MKLKGIHVKGVTVKSGKVKPFHKLAAGQRKNAFGKAKTEQDKWTKGK